MVRLIDFDDKGMPVIDRSWWSLPEFEQMATVLGHKDYALVVVLLNAYRSPYNRISYAERKAKVIEDFPRRWSSSSTLRPMARHLDLPVFKEAERVFRELQFDPKWDRLIMLEDKLDEFTQAIKNTPVCFDLGEMFKRKKTKKKRGRRFEDEDDDFEDDDEFPEDASDEPKLVTSKDQADMLKALLLTQKAYAQEYEELRIEIFRLSKDKKGNVRQAKARDFYESI
ncbi:hypothetical protein [Spirosoma sordidisoli]|uniref:Uncharacterized protein n=1 Tax=Spirosoma sordidisoli TaxID=2502893 RepID=A0A4Q2UK23_9BACT|nr:hypothetical protein [Spirosoma sordidisoli]RYC69614.1 hypothetical protein EQG79_13505 [Spirosoma sordidisoli]